MSAAILYESLLGSDRIIKSENRRLHKDVRRAQAVGNARDWPVDFCGPPQIILHEDAAGRSLEKAAAEAKYNGFPSTASSGADIVGNDFFEGLRQPLKNARPKDAALISFLRNVCRLDGLHPQYPLVRAEIHALSSPQTPGFAAIAQGCAQYCRPWRSPTSSRMVLNRWPNCLFFIDGSV